MQYRLHGPVWLALALLVTFQAGSLRAQEISVLPLLEGSTVRIDGTSNKSDWAVDVTEMDGTLWLLESEAGFDPDSVVFRTRSAELKSGVSPIMDRLMYRALKSSTYPDIVYTLGSAGVVRAAARDTMRWKTIGKLDLAGVTDTLSATVSGYKDAATGRFVFAGSHRMSMREHDVTPPTALFGALHTSEWVTVSFRLVFGER